MLLVKEIDKMNKINTDCIDDMRSRSRYSEIVIEINRNEDENILICYLKNIKNEKLKY
jgi:hypothetical protein